MTEYFFKWFTALTIDVSKNISVIFYPICINIYLVLTHWQSYTILKIITENHYTSDFDGDFLLDFDSTQYVVISPFPLTSILPLSLVV